MLKILYMTIARLVLSFGNKSKK